MFISDINRVILDSRHSKFIMRGRMIHSGPIDLAIFYSLGEKIPQNMSSETIGGLINPPVTGSEHDIMIKPGG